MGSHYSDEQLITAYKGGNERAFSELVERHLVPLYSFIYRLVGNAHDAEDVIQEAWVKIWKNMPKYNSTKNFKAWLFAIARNCAIDFLRKKKALVFSDFENDEGENVLTDTLTDTAPLPDEQMERAYDREYVERMLMSLPHASRELLLLHHMEGLTFDEIAMIVGRPLNTVKSSYRRVLLHIRALNAPKP